MHKACQLIANILHIGASDLYVRPATTNMTRKRHKERHIDTTQRWYQKIAQMKKAYVYMLYISYIIP